MRAAEWHDFAVMFGGASAALTGLLFVAVSLNTTRISAHRGLRARAAETLTLFLIPLVWSGVLLVPGQDRVVLGAELIAVAIAAGFALVSLHREVHTQPGDSDIIAKLINQSGPNLFISLALLVSGILVCAKWYSGLYVAVAPLIAAILSGVVTAWHFLVPPSAADRPVRESG